MGGATRAALNKLKGYLKEDDGTGGGSDQDGGDGSDDGSDDGINRGQFGDPAH